MVVNTKSGIHLAMGVKLSRAVNFYLPSRKDKFKKSKGKTDHKYHEVFVYNEINISNVKKEVMVPIESESNTGTCKTTDFKIDTDIADHLLVISVP